MPPARRLARSVGVPHVPGTLEPAPVDRPDQLAAVLAAGSSVGFPLLVKAAAGGGGRGMRRVVAADELPAALVAGSRDKIELALTLLRETHPRPANFDLLMAAAQDMLRQQEVQEARVRAARAMMPPIT